MNDSDIFDYLLQMGVMRPEQEDLKRRQAMVDALRQGAMTPAQGQMVSGHYVPSGLAGLAGQLGQAYFAKQGQGAVDKAMMNPNYNPKMSRSAENMPGLVQRQQEMLENLRKRKMMGASAGNEPMMDGTGYY